MTQIQSNDLRNSFLFFKPVPEGYVFRAPNPWIFGPADHYLVSEAQRDAIAAILLAQRSPRALAKRIAISTAIALAAIAGIFALFYFVSDHLSAVVNGLVAAATTVFTLLALFAVVHVATRRNLRRLAPILADARPTDQRITNAEIREAIRKKSSLKQSWLIAITFGTVSLLNLMVLLFERHHMLPFFSDLSFGPMLQMVLFAFLATMSFRTALTKSAQNEPISPGKASILARHPRQVVLGSAAALLGLAIVIVLVGVRREFSDHSQGLRYEAAGEHDNAIASFSKAIKNYPNDPAAYAGRAESYKAKGEHDLAIADLSKLIELNPKDAETFIARGRSFDAKGDRRSAVADFTKAIEIDPKQFYAHLWRGRSLDALGDRAGAIADLTRALEINPKDANAYVSRARILDAKGDHERALADFAEAISFGPKHSFAHFWRGMSRATKGDHAGAIEDFAKELEFHPKDANVYSFRARSYETKGEHAMAIADFAKAIENKPDFALVYRQRASIYANQGDRDSAIADFTRAIELTPKDVFALVSRGVIFAARNEHDLAIADLTQALALDPRNAGNYIVRGRSFAAKGEHEPAIADFTAAIAIAPKDKSAYSSRAASYAATGARDLAIADYNTVLGLPATTPADRQWQSQARERIARLSATSPPEPKSK